MKLIIGGSYAGKTEYVKRHFGLTEKDIFDMRDFFKVPGISNAWDVQNARDVQNVKDVQKDRDVQKDQDVFSIPDVSKTKEHPNMPDGLDAKDSSETPDILTADAEQVIRRMEEKKCLLHLEEWVRALLAAKKEPLGEAKKLFHACPDRIFVMNEIGNGIVPMEREERIWREAVGQVGCYLAGCAEEVVRVVCGLPVQIKR